MSPKPVTDEDYYDIGLICALETATFAESPDEVIGRKIVETLRMNGYDIIRASPERATDARLYRCDVCRAQVYADPAGRCPQCMSDL